jgi:bifunctional non-homologous end joining protein LigD
MPSNPQALLPMLPSVADAAFDSADHIYDLKWGGVRVLAFIERARLRLVAQSGRDITAWFPELASLVGQVDADEAVIDGEIVALGDDGEPDLALLGDRLATGGAAPGNAPYLLQAYDLLRINGRSLLEEPLTRRREKLARTLRQAGPAILQEYVERDGLAYFEAAAAKRLPGLVAKEKTSLYYPGRRTAAWQEIRVYESGWFVVGGYALGAGKEAPVAALLLGEPVRGERLRYIGQLPGDFGRPVEEALARLTAAACPFVSTPNLARLAYWSRPELVCEVKYAQREPDGRLRFPAFVVLRPDLSPRDCVTQDPTAARAPAR